MQKQMTRFFFLMTIASLPFTGGCAFGTRYVTFDSPANPAVKHFDSRTAVSSTSPANNVLLMPFEDQRDNKSMVGEVRNGYGMKTADVAANNDVVEWVNQTIADSLQKKGFNVYLAKNRPNAFSGFVVSGQIMRIFCTALMQYEAEASLFIAIEREGKELSKKNYSGKGSAGLNFAMTSSSYGESLSLALNDALSLFLIDLQHEINMASQAAVAQQVVPKTQNTQPDTPAEIEADFVLKKSQLPVKDEK